jgi:large subunit ribosomal protein L10
MSKAVKEMIIRELTDTLKGVSSLVVLNPLGVAAKDDNSLRRAFHGKKIEYLVVKNTLARLAMASVGLRKPDAKSKADPAIDGMFEGPSAIAFSRELEIKEVATEVLAQVKKFPKVQVKGGLVEGEKLDAKGVETVATGPGRKEYIGRIASLLMGPAGRLASLLQSPASNLLGTIRDVEKKAGEGAAPAAADGAPATT